MTTKYLDSNGLSYFWGKIKALIPTKTSDITNDSGFITNPNIPYCTCATAGGTKAKTTTIVSGTFTADDLVTGAQVLVKFTNANSVADPTLKIGSTTAKTIKRYGTTAPSTSAASSWNAGAVMMFTYDGTYWLMVDWVNTTYTSMTVAEIEAGTGTTARSITPARLKTAVETWASGGQGTITEVKTTAGTHTAIDVTSGSASFNVPTNTSHLTNDSGFVTSSSLATVATSGDYTDLTNKPVFRGSTTTKTPTEVKTALDNGYRVNITHIDNTYGLITANSFNDSASAGVIVANVVFYYTGVGLLCFELIGNLNTDAWANNIYMLAQSSDIPTVPTNISAFINDSGYITTDINVTQTNATPSSYTYWRPLVVGTSSNSTEGFTPTTSTGTTYTFNTLEVQPSSGTIRMGCASMYQGSYTTKISPTTLTANRTVTIPNASGTMALTSDIHNVPSGGTSGQVLAKNSNTDYDLTWANVGGGSVTDVEVNGTSVVSGGVASVTVPTYTYEDEDDPTTPIIDSIASFEEGVPLGTDTPGVYITTELGHNVFLTTGAIEIPTVIQASGSSTTNLTAGSITQMALDGNAWLCNNTVDAQVDDTLGGIIINRGGLYKIYGSVYITASSANVTQYGAYIKKSTNQDPFSSSTEIVGGLSGTAKVASCDYVATIGPKLVNLDIDDVVYLAGRVTGASGVMKNDNPATFIHLERVVEFYDTPSK